jgi:fatty-acyl-CoA synthase
MDRELDVCTVLDAIAADRPDAEALIHGDRRLTRAEVAERTNRLANHLTANGLGCRTERSALAGHESGQDHLAIYLHNGVEYLESMLGAWKARVGPFNVNYRYVADELRYLLDDAGARAIVVQSCFAPTLADVLPSLPMLDVIIQVPDGSGNTLLPGAVWYDDVLAGSSPQPPTVVRSPDDLYILYTGGTTGNAQGRLVAQR